MMPENWKGAISATSPYTDNHQLKLFVNPPTSDTLFAARNMVAALIAQNSVKINGWDRKVSVEDELQGEI